MAAPHLRALAAFCLPLAASAVSAAPGPASVVDAMPPATVEALFLEPLQRMDPAMAGLSAALGRSPSGPPRDVLSLLGDEDRLGLR
ncbi:MAG TPA: hypothetical protein VFA20_34385 [Myxococcaceae bacterium]|nr:hypothetical protein [Myxococcaceae bacterium]